MNKKAFTLLEALLGIMLMSILITLIMYFFLIINQSIDYNYEQKELALFMSQIQDDLLETQDFSVQNDQISLNTYNKEEILYKKDGNRLIRQVHQQGYEIMLTELLNVYFTEDGSLININIMFKNENAYKGVIGAIK